MNAVVDLRSLPMTEQERQNLRRLVDYRSVQSLPEIWGIIKEKFSQKLALCDPHANPPVQLTYAQFIEQMHQFAAGLQSLGLHPVTEGFPMRIAQFADNSPRWMIADQGIMLAGGANVVRSSQTDRHELLYLLENSGSTGLIIENLATLQKLRPELDDLPVQWVVLLSDEEIPPESLKILNFTQLMNAGKNQPLKTANYNHQTLATLLYTSGTTGKPKGVMLTHGNLLHQINTFGVVLQPTPGDAALSLLPTWHAYERSVEYFLLSQGCTQIYTNLRQVKNDLKKHKPEYMVGVPRLWESIYEGVQKQFREQPANKQKLVKTLLELSRRYVEAKRIVQELTLDVQPPSLTQKIIAAVQVALLWPAHQVAERLVYQKVRQATGGNLKYVISGGGSLAMHLDTFFEIAGINILVGYGLTETSPVLTVRRPNHNLRGSSGLPMPATEIRIADPETKRPLKMGERGLVLARGPQVMQGYFQNPEATRKAIDGEGWFDTGDLGWINRANDLVITGRAKDTIVLSNGENIEPQPIEDACIRSPYIDQMMLVGQDQKVLGALIVPNFEALQKWAGEQNITLPTDLSDLNHTKPIQTLFRQELNREVQNRPGYRADDRIGPFKLINEPFTIENGLMTQTLKIKRPVVMERYRDMINGMFS
jgi:long-chain acyl-CoA synthetase